MWKTLLALGLLAGPAAAQIPGLTLTPVPIPSPRTVNPYRIGPGSNGRIWFTDVTFLPRQVGFIASSGAITAFKLVDSADPNNEVRPLAITEGPDGNGWFTISVTDSSGSPLRTEIGRVTPTGVITRFPTPTVDACRVFGRNPVCDITVGPDGNLWFTETHAKRIGKITLSGQITEYLADGPGGEFFYGITAGPDGNLWVADSGSDIIRITTAGSITFFNRQGLVPIEITAGPDGNVWFTDRASDSIGRITPTGVITLFPTPSPTSDPEGIARGSDGKLYFTEVSARKIGQIDPATGVINEVGVPNGEAPFDIVSRVGINKIGGAGIIGDIGDMVINAANAVGDYTIYVAELTNQLLPPSKLIVEKSVFTPALTSKRLGDFLTFVFKVKKESPAAGDLFSIKLTDVLPPCVEFYSILEFTLQKDETCSFSAGVLTCTKLKLIGVDLFTFRILTRLKRPELCVNTATVTALSAEGTPVNAEPAQAEVAPGLDTRDFGAGQIDPESQAATSGRLFGSGKKD